MTTPSKTAGAIESISITIPAAGPSYLVGARLLAVLAHPPPSVNDTRWQHAERALGRLMWAGRAMDTAAPLDAPETVVPSHLLLPEAKMKKGHKALRRALDERMAAAHIGIPFLRDAARAHVGNSPARRAKTVDGWIVQTLAQEARRLEQITELGTSVSPRFRPEDVGNFETRVVRRSLPVIHLAVAVALAIDASQKSLRARPGEADGMPADVGGPQISIGDILVRPELAHSIIAQAAELEALLPHMARLKPKLVVQIRCE